MQSLADPGQTMQLRCGDVTQRNWSRITHAASVQGDETYFVKQYIDKAGTAHPDHFQYEKEGALLASQALSAAVHVPALKYRDETSLLNVFEFTNIVSIDVLLRTDPSAFERCFASVVCRMAEVLAAMQVAGQSLQDAGIPIKRRDFGGPADSLNFKGFEIRNAGVPPDAPAEIGSADLVLFDFVRPYLAPVEEAAAKLFVSIGLLNWGSPVSRFMKGPDTELLAMSRPLLERWLDGDAIAAELDLQERFRMAELKSGGGMEKMLKLAGLTVLGKKYLHDLRVWCSENI